MKTYTRGRIPGFELGGFFIGVFTLREHWLGFISFRLRGVEEMAIIFEQLNAEAIDSVRGWVIFRRESAGSMETSPRVRIPGIVLGG